jgi:predicted nucleic acid-binding Zn ribbon protein
MDERKRISNQSSLGDVIDKLMKAYGLDGRMKEMEIINKWEEMMGRAVSSRTKNIYIKNQVLHLTLDSSVMRDELMQGKSIIIQRINETAGCAMIRDVWFS